MQQHNYINPIIISLNTPSLFMVNETKTIIRSVFIQIVAVTSINFSLA